MKTVFTVDANKTLRLAGYKEPVLRKDFYDDVEWFYSKSPADLIDAMSQCPPLQWEVDGICADQKQALEATLAEAIELDESLDEVEGLKSLLQKFPDDSGTWVKTLTDTQFADIVLDQLARWFRSPPNWNNEREHLPFQPTSAGAAYKWFSNCAGAQLEQLGIVFVDGESPSSDYRAAEITKSINAVNEAAMACGLEIEFVDRLGHEIKEALKQKTSGSGSFKEIIQLPSGEHRTYEFSQAVAMANKAKIMEYEKKFGKVPYWLALCHPCHQTLVMEAALKLGCHLPDEFNV